MFLTNSINNPIPYLKNEDEFTPIRETRDQWNRGSKDLHRVFWKILDDQPVANDRWVCHHLGQMGNIQMRADRQMERQRKLEMECQLREHEQINTDVESRGCSKKPECSKYESMRETSSRYQGDQSIKDPCYQVPKLLEGANEMLKCARPKTTGTNSECCKVEVHVPSMITTEVAPKFQIKGSKLLRICGCTRRNGLQAECPMIECMGRRECLSQPVPLCKPSGTQELVRKVYDICCERN
ncbi:hypothetical protein O3M35_006681 [Rhynocoris fuscipes]|uniref:Uncharacterized protein n=1 Tax=Rhynocoris fuscipes TaxID=488301 RepID=A0AAW1DG05_9HEMI